MWHTGIQDSPPPQRGNTSHEPGPPPPDLSSSAHNPCLSLKPSELLPSRPSPSKFPRPIKESRSFSSLTHLDNPYQDDIVVLMVPPQRRTNAAARMAAMRGGIRVPRRVLECMKKSNSSSQKILEEMGYSEIGRKGAKTLLLSNLEDVPFNQVPNLNQSIFESLDEDIISKLSPLFFKVLTPRQIRRITPRHIASMSKKQILSFFQSWKSTCLNKDSLEAIPKEVISAIPPPHIRYIELTTIKKFTREILQAFSEKQITYLSEQQIKTIPPEVLVSLAPEKLRALSDDNFSTLSIEHVEALILTNQYLELSEEQQQALPFQSYFQFLAQFKNHGITDRSSSINENIIVIAEAIRTKEASSFTNVEIQTVFQDLEQIQMEIKNILSLLKANDISKKYREFVHKSIAKILKGQPYDSLLRYYQDQLSTVEDLIHNLRTVEIRIYKPEEIQSWSAHKCSQLSPILIKVMTPQQVSSFLPQQLRILSPEASHELLLFHNHRIFNAEQLKSLIKGRIGKRYSEISKFQPHIIAPQHVATLNSLTIDIPAYSSNNEQNLEFRDPKTFDDNELNILSDTLQKIKCDFLSFIEILRIDNLPKNDQKIVHKLISELLDTHERSDLLRTCQGELSTIRMLQNRVSHIDSNRDGLDVFTKLGDWGFIQLQRYKDIAIKDPRDLSDKLGISEIRDLRRLNINNAEEFVAYILQDHIQEKLRS
ncbi:MAG: hypothetical protein ACI8RA_001773 [Chlamydiales bacterium]|jgi:hypothetical protein